MEDRFDRRRMPLALGAISLMGALILLLGAGIQSAQATEYQFCWGKKLAGYQSGCQGPQRYYSAAYANADKAGVCLFIWDRLSGCLKNPNEGVYDNYGDGYGHLSQPQIVNWSLANVTATVYGIGWDGPPPPESPPPPPPPVTQYRYMLGTSTGSGVSSWQQILSGMGAAQATGAGDISGDGKADLVTIEDEGNGKYRYMLGNSNGSGIASWSQILSGMSPVNSLQLGDLTGDGKDDIVAIESEGNGKFRYVLGTSNGSGVSSWKSILTGMGAADDMAVGDFTGDGKEDILTVENDGSGKFRYMLGTSNGSGIASWNQVLSGMGDPLDMELGDVTGDGKADVVSEEPEGTGPCRYMLGTSSGAGISSWKQVLSKMTCAQFDVGDFSGDGKADIVAFENAGSGQYRYMLGASNGSGFAWSQILGGLGPSPKRSLGDVTGDGKADIVGIEQE
jgi:uncharacterized protein YegP (UPF0339 family)